jgi:hypothetical protein
MGKSFRADDLNQSLLFPPSLHDWLPENHLARFLADVVNALDLEGIYASYSQKGKGSKNTKGNGKNTEKAGANESRWEMRAAEELGWGMKFGGRLIYTCCLPCKRRDAQLRIPARKIPGTRRA